MSKPIVVLELPEPVYATRQLVEYTYEALDELFGDDPGSIVVALVKRCRELEAIVAKVPKMADGVVIMPDQDVWLRTDDGFVSGVVLSITWGNYFIECLVRDGYGKQDTRDSEDCYSTLEAAHAAEEEEEV